MAGERSGVEDPFAGEGDEASPPASPASARPREEEGSGSENPTPKRPRLAEDAEDAKCESEVGDDTDEALVCDAAPDKR